MAHAFTISLTSNRGYLFVGTRRYDRRSAVAHAHRVKANLTSVTKVEVVDPATGAAVYTLS
jgi:hypothetical protein